MEAKKEIVGYLSFLNQYVEDTRFDLLLEELKRYDNDVSTEVFKGLLNQTSLLTMNNFLQKNQLSKNETELFQRLLIENITYSSLRVVYLENTKEPVNIVDVKERTEGLFIKK